MKSILIYANQITNQDLSKIFKKIDPNKEKYLLNILERRGKLTREKLSKRLNPEWFDVVIFPLQSTNLEQGLLSLDTKQLLDLEGVKFAHDLEQHNYKGKIILTTPFVFYAQIERLIRDFCDPERNSNDLKETPFINLYSLLSSERESKLLNSLEGIPLY